MGKWTRVVKANENEAKKYLRNLIYQVNNGGILQYCFNGYADDLLEYIKSHDIIQELKDLGCPEDGIKIMQGTIDKLQNEKPMAQNEFGDDEMEDVEKWADTDDQYWMDEFDNWFYGFNMDKLDDWTEQSHTHSVILDTIKNKGE